MKKFGMILVTMFFGLTSAAHAESSACVPQILVSVGSSSVFVMNQSDCVVKITKITFNISDKTRNDYAAAVHRIRTESSERVIGIGRTMRIPVPKNGTLVSLETATPTKIVMM